MASSRPAPPASSVGLWSAAAAAGAAAGLLLLLRDFGTPLPYQDQWKCTGVEVLLPWAEGRLTAGHFFVHHNDHPNAVGRLTSFALLRINGQWNNLAESLLALALLVAAIRTLVRTAGADLARLPLALTAAFAAFAFALPYSWENTLFGIQVNVTAEVLCALVYFRTLTAAEPFSRAWWLGQLAAGAALLTQRSGMMAAATAVPVLLARWGLERGDRRGALAGLAVAAGWLAVFAFWTPALATTSDLRASSWRLVLDSGLRQLGWPWPHPAAALLLQAPVLWLAFEGLRRRRLPAAGWFIGATVVWVALHAVAVGYARGGVTTGFVSRYTTYLAVGLVANAAALGLLARLVPGRGARLGLALLAAGWSVVAVRGLLQESTTAHAGYNLERRLEVNRANLAAVEAFVTRGDAGPFASEAIRRSLYPDPPTLVRLLSEPRVRALLPPETGAVEARAGHGRLDVLIRLLLGAGPYLGFAFAAGAAAFALTRPHAPAPLPAGVPASAGYEGGAFLAAGTVAAVAWAALLAWEQPWTFDRTARLAALPASAGQGRAFPLRDAVAEHGRPLAPGELTGAVSTVPAELRPAFHGTLLGGADYTGIAVAGPVVIGERQAVALLTGWPNHPGNAVRWEVEDPATGTRHWLPALGAPEGPGDGIRLWVQPLDPYAGWRLRLYLYDGTRDDRGWVGVATPFLTDDPELGRRWLALVDAERAESSHGVVLAVALAVTLAAGVAGGRRARRGA